MSETDDAVAEDLGRPAFDSAEPADAGGDGDDQSDGGPRKATDFIRTIVREDLDEGRYDRVVTRFPPEPNGYLHIGHAKSILLNFGIAQEFGGRCHLRFDDTNPLTEEVEYAEAIKRDVRWLGFDWGDHLYHAADYFDRLYEYAEILVKRGLAYVDSQSEEEIRENRGTVTEAGTESPYRNRSVEENLDLLRRMKEGEFGEGEHVLRAKIDMSHPNMLMRDPLLYRIRHATHYRTGDEWCIYPMYDFAHCLEDAVEGVTHSLCTLEFANNRELYDWILERLGFEEPRPHQYEFARGELDYTVMSKRKLLRLVQDGQVAGWDDPRMPTLAAFRRRGVPPEALLEFWRMVGVARSDSRVDVGKLEFAVRDHLNHIAPRVMAVLDPVKLVVENYPEGETDWLEAPYYPRDVDREGSRKIPFTRELWIEREDFSEDPPEGFWRLTPGREVRLRYGYVVECTGVERDPESGEITAVRCSYDPETRGGTVPDGRKVKGTIHWVSAEHALEAEVRLYDRLFQVPDPDDVPEGEDITYHLNPDSLQVRENARIEPSVRDDPKDLRYQFERTGYFWRDPEDSTPDRPVFNRIVTLRDTWTRRREEEKARAAEERKRERRREERSRPHPIQTPEDRISDERRAAREANPELARRMERYREELGLSLEDADILTGSTEMADFFEEALEEHDEPGEVAAWITNDLRGELDEGGVSELPFDGRDLGRLISLVAGDRISRRVASEILTEMVEEGVDPEKVVRSRGLEKISDPAVLEETVSGILEEWPDKVKAYRDGHEGLFGFFMGKVMAETKGRADPGAVQAILRERLQ